MENGKTNHQRIAYSKIAPEGIGNLGELEVYIKSAGLEPALVELVKLRASQINGCGYCIDMHTYDARTHGENEKRLYGVTAWRETPFYNKRERAALAMNDRSLSSRRRYVKSCVNSKHPTITLLSNFQYKNKRISL